MSDKRDARVDAAARVFYASQGGANYETSYYRENWYAIAKRALAAADEVVAVEMIAEVVADVTAAQQNQRLGSDDSVWTPSDFNLDAREVAEAVQRLYRGEAGA